MVVCTVATAEAVFDVTGDGYSPKGEIKRTEPRPGSPVVTTMARASVLCNESSIHEEDGMWKLTGDPTEGARLRLCRKGGTGLNG